MYLVDQQTLLNKPRTAICAELTKTPQGLDTMETEVSPSLEQFMQSPLVTWVRTFGQVGDLQGGMLTEYKELADGTFLNKIMDQINPEVAIQGINKANGDERQRTQNLSVLTHRIKSYYQESLQQLIMLPLPNAVALGRSPFCEQSLDEMKKLLLLLLGCAVQCENKEEYIERIQTLDFDTKASIASHIQEVTHCQENVFDLHWLDVSDLCPEELVSLSRNMAVHLSRLVDQRDLHLESIAKLTQERDCVHSDDPSPAGSSRIHQAVSHKHLGVELADSKARIRRLRQELEEKSEQLLDCRQELESTEAGVKKLQQENMQLLTDARAARTYRDELDALREKAIRADKLESEVGRYRERLHNMEFYKAKVEELKEDNQVLLETKALLEEQMEGSRACSEKLHQLEKHTVHLQAKLQDMEEERALSRRCMEELLEEKVALELAQRRSMEESCRLGWELEQVSKDPAGTVQKSLGQEVTESACSRLLRLERENQSLQKALQELRGAWRPLEDPSNSTSHAVEVNGLTEKVELSDKDTISPNERSVETSLKYSNLELELNGRSPRLERESERSFGQEKASLEAEPGSLKEKEKEQLALQHTAELLSTQDRYSPETGSRLSALTKQLGVPEPVLTQSCETENRQLRSALENAWRKLRRLDAQLQELETENQALQSSAEELRISGRRLDQLEAEKRALEQDHAQWERDRGRLEKENRRLRQRADIQEASLEGSTMRQSSLERENRVLTKEATALKEACTRTKELEGDNQELLKQAAASKRTMANLREELVGEKLKTQQKQNELEKLSHELSRMGLDQERLMSDQETTEHSRYKQLESELEASLKRSLEIKEEKIAALEARLQESSSLNQQLRQELRTVKQNYEALAQREEEERVGRSSPPQAGREWQRESQEATQELLRVKDRLIEVERNNARLQAERQALQAQLQQLQAQSQGLQAQIVALQRQTATLQESNTALQTHNAQLQVEKSTISSQGASLMAQNARLQRQQFSVEGEKESALRDRDDLRTVNELLLRDHERLAALHEKQTAEFEVLVAKHGELKTSHHSLGLEQRSLEDRYNTLLKQKAQLEGVEKALKEEQEKMQQETENHRRTSAECQRLRDEKDWLNQTYQKLLQDHEGLQADHRNLRCTLNSSKLEQTRLESELAKLRQQHQHLDVESAKLTNQCELLTQLKGNLEEENRHLLEQIQSLMLQNRTLLEQTMESKDLFHVEQRQYIDKLNELRRQKEKLEEKIMDQYRFYDPPSPRRRGNWITLKVKKLIKSRSRERERVRSLTPPARSESCEGLPDLRCHDNGSFVGSQGSAESVSNSFNGEALSPKRSSISALKMFHVMRHRQKEKDKVKPSRRSLSLNDLMHAEVCWERGVARPAGGATEPTTEEHLPSMNHTADMSIHHPMPPFNHPHHSTGKDLHANATPPAHDDVPHMPSNMPSGDQSRAQSQSSGEFSMSLENEAWSGGSSPIQEPPLRRPSNPSPPALPAPVQERDGGPVPRSTGRGVWRSSSGRRSSGDPPTQRQDSARKELRKTGSVRESCSLSGLGLQAQGKSSSASGCLNCFATPLRREGRPKSGLPRASCVISTSEGASRRASIHGAHSARSGRSDPVSPGGTGEGRRGDEPPPGPPPALTEASAEAGMEGASPEEEVVPSAFPFTIDSVFTNTIFSDPVLSSGCDTHQSGGRGADKLDVDAARSAVAQDGGGLSQNGRPCTGYEDDEAVDHMAVYDQASNPPEKTLVA